MNADKYAEAERYARNRLHSIGEAVASVRADIDSEAVYEYPLDVEVLGNRERDKYHVTVLLGTGGPHDELRYAVSDGSVDHVTYWYANWGYGTAVPLTNDEDETAIAFVECLMDLDDLWAICEGNR